MVRTSKASSRNRSKAKGQATPRAEEKRLQILRAAAECFREHGFAATGMREIAARAGLSASNLYYYFKGKSHLLAYCQDRALDRMLEAVRSVRRQPPAEALRAVVVAHIRIMLGELDGASAHVEVDALPPELREPILAKRDKYERAVRNVVKAGQAQGAFAPGDPTLITRAILGALNWTARWYRPDGPVSADRVADEYATYLVRGLTP